MHAISSILNMNKDPNEKEDKKKRMHVGTRSKQ